MFGKRPPPSSGLADRVRQLGQAKPRSIEPTTKPREPREAHFREGTVTLNGGERLRVVIKDLSASGARVEFIVHRHLPAMVTLSEPTRKLRRQAQVVWQGNGAAGLWFVD